MNKKVDVAGELDYVYKAITLTRHKLEGRVPLFGFCVHRGRCFAIWLKAVEVRCSPNQDLDLQISEGKQRSSTKDRRVCVEYLALQVKAGAQVRYLPEEV